MLHTETISPFLSKVLNDLMRIPELDEYVLVGGTALSLYLGHRQSVDIDLFRPDYKSGDEIYEVLEPIFTRLNIRILAHGITVFIPDAQNNCDLKVDIMSNEPFIRPIIVENNIRIAHIEDIAAMKLEAITSRFAKKDFWDIAELLEKYTFRELTNFYLKRYPWNELRNIIERIPRINECNAIKNNNYLPDVISLNGKTWDDVKNKIILEFDKFIEEELG